MTQVQIPAGCGPGSVLQIQGPQGPVMFTVPAGAVEGQTIQIQAGETTFFVKLVGVPAPGLTLPPGAAKPLPENGCDNCSNWITRNQRTSPACYCLVWLFIAVTVLIQTIIGSAESDNLEAKCRAS